MKNHLDAIFKARVSFSYSPVDNFNYLNFETPAHRFRIQTPFSRKLSQDLSQTYIQKYANIIFTFHLDKQRKFLNSCIVDLEQQQPLRTTIDEWKNIMKSREVIIKDCQHRLSRHSYYRNYKIRSSRDAYSNNFHAKFQKSNISLQSLVSSNYIFNNLKDKSNTAERFHTANLSRSIRSQTYNKKKNIQNQFESEKSKQCVTNQDNDNIDNDNKIQNCRKFSQKIVSFNYNTSQFIHVFKFRNTHLKTTPSELKNKYIQNYQDRIKRMNCNLGIKIAKQRTYRKKIRRLRQFSTIFQ